MAQSISHSSRRRGSIAIALASADAEKEVGKPRRVEVEEVPATERTRRHVWRVLTWAVVANMLLFWLLTCVTAFGESAPWAGVHLVYTPNASSYTYVRTVPTTPGTRDDGVKFRVQTTEAPIENQPAVALQRLTLQLQGRVALSTDSSEIANLQAQGWRLDGTLGFVAPRKTASTVPLYRITHDSFKLNIYTTKSPGKNSLVEKFGWREAGIVGYVMAATDSSGNTVGTTSMGSRPVPQGQPSVTSFAPASGLVGASIQITGSNFVDGSNLRFNGTAAASVAKISSSTLQVTVPVGATTGKISVTTTAGTATSSSVFTVTAPPPAPPPTVASFAPQSGPASSVITIVGTNLTGATAVRFNGVGSTVVTSITATSLQASVPSNASSGKISVTTSGGAATTTLDFTVTVPPPIVNAAHTEAARFLTQATFGPKPASLDRVKAIGISAWIDEQFTLPAALHMTYIDAAKARRVNSMGKSYYAEEDSYEAIWQQWLFGADELRARMTFALSELMVVSNIAPDLEADAMSSYMDTLNQHAFGNYRDLLGAVTLHPTMGYYLNMLGSEKEDAARNRFPNENYAREVLQLFSVGLALLNPDGTRKLDGAGVPIPTYDESVVKGFARAFTGWTFAGNDPANPKKFDRPEESWTRPMIAFASKHETGTKKLLSGVTLPAGQTAEKDMKDALDNIFNHPNVGPFVGRQLILRFVTSNPSPAYIARVSAVFDNNGRGVRGDLAAVIKAVLTDADARSAALSADAKFGKQREPVIRFANILRAFNATSVNGRNKIHYLDSADDALGQSPLLSPSVFNFFSPFYTRPGRLAQSGMVGPEFQITNEIQTVGTANFFYDLIKNEAYGSGDSRLKLDLSTAKNLSANPVQLVDYLSGLLTYGDLSPGTRQIIIDAVTAVPFNNRDSDRSWRVRTAVSLFALSADFVIQK